MAGLLDDEPDEARTLPPDPMRDLDFMELCGRPPHPLFLEHLRWVPPEATRAQLLRAEKTFLRRATAAGLRVLTCRRRPRARRSSLAGSGASRNRRVALILAPEMAAQEESVTREVTEVCGQGHPWTPGVGRCGRCMAEAGVGPRSVQLPNVPDALPLVLLRERLACARAAGVPFGDAWEPAVAEIVAGCRFGVDKDTWGVALTDTRDTWQRAFLNERTTRLGSQ